MTKNSEYSQELWAQLSQLMRPGAMALVFAPPGSQIETALKDAGFEVKRPDELTNVQVEGKTWEETAPWKITVESLSSDSVVIRPESGGYAIAEIFYQSGQQGPLGTSAPHFNVFSHANLISAAPELYAACEAALTWVDESSDPATQELAQLLTLALKKAGRET